MGVPYADGYEAKAQKDLETQAAQIVKNLVTGSITNAPPDREIMAVIAYLQRLGTDIKTLPAAAKPTQTASNP